MSFEQANTIYFSGIGGIGMSALAQLLHAEGKTVLGSDRAESIVTQKLRQQGIEVALTQDGSAITKELHLFVYSDAVPPTHPERVKATELGIRSLSYFEALGEYGKQFETMIAISGTHGKSTTTAMIANIFINAGLDPTVIVGSIVKEFDSNARAGGKKMFIVEACEHQAHMLHLRPSVIVLTNIEADHLDYYRDIDHIIETFQTYINQLPREGVLVCNVDDARVMQLTTNTPTVKYGVAQPADFNATNVHYVDHMQQFTVGETVFTLRVPGTFNVSNALAAIATARQFSISDEVIQGTLATYSGIWRRFEILGTYNGATVVSDYAHHPTEIQSTITAATEFYNDQDIMVVFQPHQRSRTESLFTEFTHAFKGADFIIVQEIYDVAGREESNIQLTSVQLVESLAQQKLSAVYSADATATQQLLDEHLKPQDIVLIMGAGDIYQLAEKLVK